MISGLSLVGLLRSYSLEIYVVEDNNLLVFFFLEKGNLWRKTFHHWNGTLYLMMVFWHSKCRPRLLLSFSSSYAVLFFICHLFLSPLVEKFWGLKNVHSCTT